MATPKTQLLTGALLAVVAATGCQGNRSDLPPVHVIHNMDFQQKFDPQERNDFWEDGRAMRAPVEGTVAFGAKSLRAGDANADLLREDDAYYLGRGGNGRLVDTLPKQVEAQFGMALLERGEERYNIYCSPCHGETGRGDGMAVRKSGGFKVPPPSYHQDKFRAMPIGHFYKVISEGQGTMLPYAAQIPVADRWAIAAWVRTLQKHGKKQGWDDAPKAVMAAAPADSADAAEKKGAN